jgi:hypothetical protein
MNTSQRIERQGICTVSQMASRLKLSRARFYQLMNNGVFPPPAYCWRTKNPVYPTRLQTMCFEIRQTGVGLNGQYVRFYSQSKSTKPKSQHKQLADILREMGLKVTPQQVKQTLVQLHLPTTKEVATDTETIRLLFKHFHAGCQRGV